MYPASSRGSRLRDRSALGSAPSSLPLPPVRQLRHRPLLEQLELRTLMSAAPTGWDRVLASGGHVSIVADDGGTSYVSDGQTLAEVDFRGMSYWSVPTTASVTSVGPGGVYTDDVTRYAGDSVAWSQSGKFPGVSWVAGTPDGGAYVTGIFRTTFDADPGPGVHDMTPPAGGPDAYLIKLDASGNFQWAQDVGASGGAWGSLDATAPVLVGADAAGNAVVAETFATGAQPPFYAGSVRLTGFAPDGTIRWTDTVGAGGTKAAALAVAPGGEFAISGTTTTAAAPDFDPGAGVATLQGGADPYHGAYVARYDASGALGWVRAIQPNSVTHGSDSAPAVAISPHGDVGVVAGVSDGVSSFDLLQRYDSAGVLWDQRAYRAQLTAVAFTQQDNEFVFGGSFTDPLPITSGVTLHDPTPGTPAGFAAALATYTFQPSTLFGTHFGTPGSWNGSGNDYTKAFDENRSTFFDAPTSQAYAGVDFGKPVTISLVNYAPRAGYEGRMVGGQIQASNDGTNWTTLGTITAAPQAGVLSTLVLNATTQYRYARYLSPDGGFGNVAELSFSGPYASSVPPEAPLDPVATWDGAHVSLTWTDVATSETGYEAQLFATPDFSGTPVATLTRLADFNAASFDNFSTPGTYYVRVRATRPTSASAWVAAAGPVTIPAAPPVTSGQLTGTPFGTAGSWNDSGNTFDKALDGNTSTYFDSTQATGAVVGLDLGAAQSLSSVKFMPRSGFAWRMTGGTFQGSNDNANWTTLATISAQPADGQYSTLNLSGTYRYVRYVSPQDGFGNVAEVEFYGSPAGADPNAPAAPTNVRASFQSAPSPAAAANGEIRYDWLDNSSNEIGFEYFLSLSPDFSAVVAHGTVGHNWDFVDIPNLTAGTYYFRVRAFGNPGVTNSSPFATALPVTIGNPTGTPPPTDQSRLTGTPIGTPGSWNNSGNDFTKAFDSSTSTFFDAPTSQAYVGYDFGPAGAVVTSVVYYPRVGQESRMVGGQIRGSNDGVNWTTLGTITATPTANVPSTLTLASPAAYRYVQYLSPDGGFGNVAELQFYGYPASPVPAAPATVTGSQPSTSQMKFAWTPVDGATSYHVQISSSADFSFVIDDFSVPASQTETISTNFTPGYYYARVSAVNYAGASPFTTSARFTYLADQTTPAHGLAGTPFGSPGSWNDSGNTFDKAFDGIGGTYFDAPTPTGNYVGLDLGAPTRLTHATIDARAGFEWRLIGGQVQGSKDGTNWDTLATITADTAAPRVELTLSDANTYRYVRYLSPSDSYGNVDEVSFAGYVD